MINRRPASGAFRRWISEDSTGSFRLPVLDAAADAGTSVSDQDAPLQAATGADAAGQGVPSWTGVLEEEMGDEDDA